MHLYLESADPEALQAIAPWRLVEGAVTDPGLLADAGGDPRSHIHALLEIVRGPVLVGVTSLEAESMVDEATALAGLDERILVRVPANREGIRAIGMLAKDRIAVDACLCASVPQALLAAKAGARFLSVPVGALDGSGVDGLGVMAAILAMLDQYQLKTSVMVDHIDHPAHIAEAARMGADAAAIPPALLARLADHPLSQQLREEQLERWRRAQN